MTVKDKNSDLNPLATIPQVLKTASGKGYTIRNFDSIVRLKLESEFGSIDNWHIAFKKAEPQAIYKTAFCFLHDVPAAYFEYDFNNFEKAIKGTDLAYIVDIISKILVASISEAVEEDNSKKKSSLIYGLIIAGLAIWGLISFLYFVSIAVLQLKNLIL